MLPDPTSDGAAALSQDWRAESNYAFPPVSELPRLAQMLFEAPGVSATLVVPYWPAQMWFQQLLELAVTVETHDLAAVAAPPSWLHGSARTALTGGMLAFIRVAGRPVGFSGHGRLAA